MTDDDIVVWLLRRICDRATVATNVVLEVEQEARIHWGGARPYVPKGGAFVRTGLMPERTARHWNKVAGGTMPRPRKLQRG